MTTERRRPQVETFRVLAVRIFNNLWGFMDITKTLSRSLVICICIAANARISKHRSKNHFSLILFLLFLPMFTGCQGFQFQFRGFPLGFSCNLVWAKPMGERCERKWGKRGYSISRQRSQVPRPQLVPCHKQSYTTLSLEGTIR